MNWPSQPENPYTAQPQAPWGGNQWGAPPGWGPPPKKRRSRWWYVAPVVLGFVLFAGCGTLLFKGGVEVKHATDSVNKYAGAVMAGRYSDAYAMTCDADRANTTLEEFIDRHDDPYLGYRILNVTVSRVDGETRGVARLVLRIKDAPNQDVWVPLRKLDGEWRPCNGG